MSNAQLKTEKQITFIARDVLREDDIVAVQYILTATGVFSDEEIVIGRELIEEALHTNNEKFEYQFIFVEDDTGTPKGFACFGATPLTQCAWDLYWVATDPVYQGKGMGQFLIKEVCRRAAAAGGEWVYSEISALPQSEPSRACHIKCGFELVATLPDYYKPGDAMMIYRKSATN